MKTPCIAIALTAMVAACESTPTSPDPGPSLTTAIVSFPGGAVKAELATTRAKRESGLMNRATIAPDSGMLFAWPADQNNQFVAFYMLNTHFDLAIAFLDANRRVLNVEEMTKDTETLHFAVAPFRYALEAPKGWFASHGVTAGSVATFTIPAGVIIEP